MWRDDTLSKTSLIFKIMSWLIIVNAATIMQLQSARLSYVWMPLQRDQLKQIYNKAKPYYICVVELDLILFYFKIIT